ATSVRAVHAPGKIDGLEDAGGEGNELALAEDQDSLRPQRVVEAGENALLHLGVEVDEEVPAEDHVEPRDGSVGEKIVDAEDDGAPDVIAGGVAASLLHAPILENPRRDVLDLLRRVLGVTGLQDRMLVDVGPEDLDLLVGERRPEDLGQGD